MLVPSAGGSWRFVLGLVSARILPGRPGAPTRAGRVKVVFVVAARPLRQRLKLFTGWAQQRPRTAHSTIVVALGKAVGGVELASATGADRHGAWGRLRVPGRGNVIEEWLVGAARTWRARRRPWFRFHREDKVRTVPARASRGGVTPVPAMTEVRAALGG